jgi:hypothetical protein
MIRYALVATILAITANSATAQSRVQTGVLECITLPSVGMIVGSVREMDCVFKPTIGPQQSYTGTQGRIGLDIGVRDRAGLAWAVFSPTVQIGPGELAGNYTGVSADAALGLGVGANALLGGSNNSFALQPLSLEGQVGVNIAAGISGLTLTYRR